MKKRLASAAALALDDDDTGAKKIKLDLENVLSPVNLRSVANIVNWTLVFGLRPENTSRRQGVSKPTVETNLYEALIRLRQKCVYEIDQRLQVIVQNCTRSEDAFRVRDDLNRVALVLDKKHVFGQLAMIAVGNHTHTERLAVLAQWITIQTTPPTLVVKKHDWLSSLPSLPTFSEMSYARPDVSTILQNDKLRKDFPSTAEGAAWFQRFIAYRNYVKIFGTKPMYQKEARPFERTLYAVYTPLDNYCRHLELGNWLIHALFGTARRVVVPQTPYQRGLVSDTQYYLTRYGTCVADIFTLFTLSQNENTLYNTIMSDSSVFAPATETSARLQNEIESCEFKFGN